MIEISFIAIWILCCVFAFGGTFAHFQRKFPEVADDDYDADRRIALVFGALGPIGLVVVFARSGFKYGLKWF